MTTTSKILLGVLGAAAAGLAIGILIAPEKGKDLRDKLKKGVTDWASDLKNNMKKNTSKYERDVSEATM